MPDENSRANRKYKPTPSEEEYRRRLYERWGIKDTSSPQDKENKS